MVLAVSFATLISVLLSVFLGAWVVDLRWQARVHRGEIDQLRQSLERVSQDVITLYRGERRRVLCEAVAVAAAAPTRRAVEIPIVQPGAPRDVPPPEETEAFEIPSSKAYPPPHRPPLRVVSAAPESERTLVSKTHVPKG